MRGPTQSSFKYVLKSERESLPSEQTIFYVKVLTALDTAASLRRYSKAFTSIGNRTEVNESQYVKSYRAEFIDCVEKVENYKFGYKFKELMDKGYITFDDPETIGKMFEELPEGVVKEVIEAAKSEVAVGDFDTKK